MSSNSTRVGKLLHGAMLRIFPDIENIGWHVSFDQLFQWKMWPNLFELMRKDISYIIELVKSLWHTMYTFCSML